MMRQLSIKITRFLQNHFPSALSGKESVIRKTMYASFGPGDYSDEINRIRNKNISFYMILIVCFTASVIMILSDIITPHEVDLSRDDYGGETEIIPAEVEAKFENEVIKKQVDLIIQPMALTENEKVERMTQTKKNLPTLMLGKNKSLDDITHDLVFPKTDTETDVNLSWFIEEGSPVDETGLLNVLKAERGEKVYINVKMTIDDMVDTVVIVGKIGNIMSADHFMPSITKELETTISEINKNSSGDELELPTGSETGVEYVWSFNNETGNIVLLPVLIMMGFLLYKYRYRALYKKIKTSKEGVIKDFPGFLNKLILLLDAGMVVTSAMRKISGDYKRQDTVYKKKYLYDELAMMDGRINESNSTLCRELSEFAKRSEVRELLRFTTIINDNIDKGALLSQKLRTESDVMWNARKKKAEEEGLIAETKLTFPMVLNLLVVIMITAAPALLEM